MVESGVPPVSASACESWMAPSEYEVCCAGEHPWRWGTWEKSP